MHFPKRGLWLACKMPVLISFAFSGASASAQFTDDHVFFQTQTTHCLIKAIDLSEWKSIRLVLEPVLETEPCDLSRSETIETFRQMLIEYDQLAVRTHFSIMFGHLSYYGWLRDFLASTAKEDPDWSQQTGRPVAEKTMTYVNGVLSYDTVIDTFNQAVTRPDWRFNDISCEKILISEEGLPVDAFCWIYMLEQG